MARDEIAAAHRRGERKFADFIARCGVRLRKREDLGLKTSPGGEWDHFAWKLHVGRTDVIDDPHHEHYVFDYSMGTAHTKPPTLVQLIASLLSDASCVHGRTFEEFCAELGYDTDSRKDFATYEQIQVNNGRLLRLFPQYKSLDALIRACEPYLEEAGLR